MFAFPVTVPFRTPEGIYPLDVTVNIDDIACVNSLDKVGEDSVCSSFDELIPSSEITFVDGRKLPVLETTVQLHQYLDAYITLDVFFNTPADQAKEQVQASSNVFDLSTFRECGTSEGSTPG